jgi:hypothetical protein
VQTVCYYHHHYFYFKGKWSDLTVISHKILSGSLNPKNAICRACGLCMYEGGANTVLVEKPEGRNTWKT